MKKTAILGLIILASCAKSKQDLPSNNVTAKGASPAQQQPEVCRSGQENFNLSKRPFLQEPILSGKRAPSGGGSTGGTGTGGTSTGTTTSPAGVILLDMDGYTVSGTAWNVSGNIVCTPANLTTTDIYNILQRVQIDYSPFNLIVTLDENVYYSAPANKRMRVIVTESWEWFGQAGGTSYTGSFTWGDNTPCFVFSSILSYNPKYIADACSHEAGHTLGLYHQSAYNSSGVKTSEYNSGAGSGETSWAPIMGVGYYRNLTLWHNGPCTYGYTALQDDVSIIAGKVGMKADDYGNTISTAAALGATLNGTINSSTDVDFFKVTLTAGKTVYLAPTNAGATNTGGNVDLNIKVYSGTGTLLYTVSNPATLDASIALPAGTYYLSAASEPNTYATVYGMLSGYTISLL